MNENETSKKAERNVVQIQEYLNTKEKSKKKPKKNKAIKFFKGIKVPRFGWYAKSAFLMISTVPFRGRDYCICSKKGFVIAYFFTEKEAQKWWSSYCRKRGYEVTKLNAKKEKYITPPINKDTEYFSVNTFGADSSKDHTKNSNHCVRSGCQRFRVKPHDFCDIHL